MKLLKFVVLYNLIIIFISGCATLYGNNNHEVVIDSFPHGASVKINNIDYGNTPVSIILIDLDSLIVLKMNGYKNSFIKVNSNFQRVSYWDIIFPPLFLVDWDLGNLKKIDKNSKYFNVYLEKINFKK